MSSSDLRRMVDVGTFDEQGEYHSFEGKYATGDNSRQIWYNHGVVSRENNKPAIIDKKTGAETWIVDGVAHREDDEPSYMSNESYQWYVMGLNHRVNGPARLCKWKETPDDKEWFLYGMKVNETQHSRIIKKAAALNLPIWIILLNHLQLLDDNAMHSFVVFTEENKTLPITWVLKMHNIDEDRLQTIYSKDTDLPLLLDRKPYIERFINLINFEDKS